VSEWNSRKQLAEMGYVWTVPLTCFKADCFGIIEDELAKIQKKSMSKGK